ncbi:MAG TPA: imidazoleglycerol-phosphate dehydratase HisB [Candidatus Nitrosocosmicus sp.]|nr:imidazoleglycerol-phosphate dehydratase HisB [Candidatus Nitrosocosmicus sp.]
MIIEDHQRTSEIERKTKEVSIVAKIDLDGKGVSKINTGIDFLDHIIISFSKHSKIDIQLDAKSEDGIKHHLIEDIGIVLGQAVDKALGKRERINRFGNAMIPMDEAASSVSIDLIKRQYSHLDLKLDREKIENISQEDIIHFFQSFIGNLECCMHVIVHYGTNDHHKVESAIKATAVALRSAIKIDPDNEGELPTTKGMM